MATMTHQETPVGTAPESAAGPVAQDEPTRLPPALGQSRLRQTRRFAVDPMAYLLRNASELGEVWEADLLFRREPIVFTSHPDHAKSLFTAKPCQQHAATGHVACRRGKAASRPCVASLAGDARYRPK